MLDGSNPLGEGQKLGVDTRLIEESFNIVRTIIAVLLATVKALDESVSFVYGQTENGHEKCKFHCAVWFELHDQSRRSRKGA